MPTDISWADDSWNIVTGCAKVSDGCRFCYAERLALRHWPNARPWIAPNAAHNVTLHPERLTDPATWRKPRTIFVCSMADLFIDQVPDEYLMMAFGAMVAQPRHIFLVLTKRPLRAWSIIERVCAAHPNMVRLPSHIWIGVSAERQAEFDQRVPVLLQVRAEHLFVSLEPLLGPITLGKAVNRWPRGLDWVIAGGESGDAPGQANRWLVELIDRRDYLPTPSGHSWMRSIRDQCAEAGVHYHFKQWGGPRYDTGGRLLDGMTHDWYPQSQPDAVQGVLL